MTMERHYAVDSEGFVRLYYSRIYSQPVHRWRKQEGLVVR